MEKKIKLMGFWLIGIFVILAAGLFILYWLVGASAAAVANSGTSPILLSLQTVWPYWLGMAVLFVAVYFIYRAIASKNK